MIMLLIFVIENLFWRAEDKAHLTSEDGLRIHVSEILHLNSTQEESDTHKGKYCLSDKLQVLGTGMLE